MLTPANDPNLPSNEWVLEDPRTDSYAYEAERSRTVHFEFRRQPFRFQFGLVDLAALFVTIASLLSVGRWLFSEPGLFGYFFGLCVLVGFLVFPAIALLVTASLLQAIRGNNRFVSILMTIAGWMILVGVAAWMVLPVVLILVIVFFWFVRRMLQRAIGIFQRNPRA